MDAYHLWVLRRSVAARTLEVVATDGTALLHLRPAQQRPASPGKAPRRIAAAVVAAVVVMVCAASPVAARAPSPYTHADSVCEVSIRRGGGTRRRVEHDGPWVQLQFWARVGSNPVTSLSWREGTTRAIWDIEVEGDRDVDFRAVADTTSAGDYHGTVDNVTGGTAACAAEAGFFDGRAYSLTFRRACIGNPARLRVRLDFAFDASVVAGRPVTHDRVPTRGRWSDPISHAS